MKHLNELPPWHPRSPLPSRIPNSETVLTTEDYTRLPSGELRLNLKTLQSTFYISPQYWRLLQVRPPVSRPRASLSLSPDTATQALIHSRRGGPTSPVADIPRIVRTVHHPLQLVEVTSTRSSVPGKALVHHPSYNEVHREFTSRQHLQIP